jgi:hypothetical protein
MSYCNNNTTTETCEHIHKCTTTTTPRPTFVLDTNNYDTDLVSAKIYTCKTGVGDDYTILNLRPPATQGDGEQGEEVGCDGVDLGVVAPYRSVICRRNTAICMAPPKGMPVETFTQKYPVGPAAGARNDDACDTADMYVNDVIEGTMINLFYDQSVCGESCGWEIATKGAVGGNYWYLRTQYPTVGINGPQLTFRQMFLEACGVGLGDDLADVSWIGGLDSEYIYSFVLQHPLNHIVGWVPAPKLWLVAVYKRVGVDGGVVDFEYVSPLEYESWPVFGGGMGVHFPKWYPFHGGDAGYTELETLVAGLPFEIPGVMVTHLGSGDRCRIDHPKYMEALAVRGNHPNLQYHYLTMLKGMGNAGVAEFLEYFPWYEGVFQRFYWQLVEFVRGVHQAYVDRYVQRIAAEGEVSKRYAPHIWRLHNQTYLPGLAVGQKVVIRKEVVWGYVWGLEVKELMAYLNQ